MNAICKSCDDTLLPRLAHKEASLKVIFENLGPNWCAVVWHLHTGDNSLFKIDNREQKKFLLAHRRSLRKVPYSADWETNKPLFPCLSALSPRRHWPVVHAKHKKPSSVCVCVILL